jgi:hypothetical protein
MSYYRIDGSYIDIDNIPKIIEIEKRKHKKPTKKIQKKQQKIEKFSVSSFNNASIPSETDKERLRRKAKQYEKEYQAAKEYAEKNAEIKQVTKCFSMQIDPVMDMPQKKQSTKEIKKKTKPTPKPIEYKIPSLKDIDDPYSIKNITKYLDSNRILRFYDKKMKEVSMILTKANEICLTKADRTVCVANNRFSINADPIRVADIERGDVIIPYRKKPSPPIYIKPKPKPAVPYRNPNKPLSVFMKKYGTVVY